MITAAVLPDHGLSRLAAAEEGAGDVGVDHLPPFRQAGILRGLVAAHRRRVVHQHVDAALPGQSGLHQAYHVLLPADVRLQAQEALPGRIDFALRLFQYFDSPAAEHQAGALPVESLGDGPADARAPAGDQHDLAFETSHAREPTG
jgi:hypothetical protein